MSGSAEVIRCEFCRPKCRRMSASTQLADWVHAKRDLGALSFVVLRDRAGLVQVVLSEPLELVPETVVEVEGQAVAAAQAPGGVELRKPTFRILAQPRGAAARRVAPPNGDGNTPHDSRLCAP